jgi:hypothetical protein
MEQLQIEFSLLQNIDFKLFMATTNKPVDESIVCISRLFLCFTRMVKSKMAKGW